MTVSECGFSQEVYKKLPGQIPSTQAHSVSTLLLRPFTEVSDVARYNIIATADGTGIISEDICGERLEELCDEVSNLNV